MDIQALLKIQCGLFVAAVGTPEKTNGCITNTLMEQSHVPPKLSVTLDKNGLTHELAAKKRSMCISVLAEGCPTELIKRFGFVSGRAAEKFAGHDDYTLDQNGNPAMTGDAVAAVFSLSVYDTVDMGTHTMFLCTIDDMTSSGKTGITYAGYRAALKK